MPTRTHSTLIWLLLPVILCLGGCSKSNSVLAVNSDFHLEVPSEFSLDEELNPHGPHTSTWFREDRRALLAVDVQPLAGPRRERLLKYGKSGYLEELAQELEGDFGTHLKVFEEFRAQLREVEAEPVLEITLITDHEGRRQRSYLLLAVLGGEQPREVMVDYRIPLEETEEDKNWAIIRDSISFSAGPSPEPEHGQEESAEESGEKKHETKKSEGH